MTVWFFIAVVILFVQVQRLPPLKSSMIALETLLGEDERLGAEERFDGKVNF